MSAIAFCAIGTMSPAFSNYLNAARIGAALAVLLFHWTILSGEHQWYRSLKIGADAVVVFFVLSGFLVAYTADTKDRTLGRYAFNRATRLYSVLVPAIGLTLAVGFVLGYSNTIVDVLRAVTFTGHIWNGWTHPDPNGAIWSVIYEAWYYAIFGCLFYLRDWRGVVFAVMAIVIAGPNILVLMPCWWLGVGVYRRLQRPVRANVASAMAFVPVLSYVLLHATGALREIHDLTSIPFKATLLHVSVHFLRDWVVAILFAIHLIGVASLMRGREAKWQPGVTWAAGATFSLYLTHLPVLKFMMAVMLTHRWLGIAACIAVASIFAWAFERRLGTFRQLLKGAEARMALRPATSPTGPVAHDRYRF
jgi:peptidoglycan/LPS O-acetylase OafA/YrhL